MLSFIDNIIKAFLGIDEPVDHPFGNAVATDDRFEVEETTEQLQDGYNIVEWGDKEVVAKVQHTTEGFEYEVVQDDSRRLKTMQLDEFDKKACLEHNNKCKHDNQKVTLNEMKLIKPYVLSSQNWTYKEMTEVVGYKKRWLQRVGPRVKAAQRLRLKSLSPTVK